MGLSRRLFGMRKDQKTAAEKNRMERPTRDFDSFFAHLKRNYDYSPSICVDVGAASGTQSIYSAFPEAFHIVFEPLIDFNDQLKVTMRPYRHEVHNCALLEESGERMILRHKDLYGSSLMHQHKKDSSADLASVPIKTLDEIMGGRDLSGGLLIKTDCQGSDLLALKGGVKTLACADVVIVESSLFRFWGEHHPDIYDIMTFMHEHDFALYDILDGLYRPFDHALGQVDLAFVKKTGKFRKDRRWV